MVHQCPAAPIYYIENGNTLPSSGDFVLYSPGVILAGQYNKKRRCSLTLLFFLSPCILPGVSNCTPEASVKAERSLPHSISHLKKSNHLPHHHHPHPQPHPHPHLHHHQVPQHAHLNGNHLHFPPAASTTTAGSQENLSDEDEEESGPEAEEEEEEGTEQAPRRWNGIEAIFEAYQEYVDGESTVWKSCLQECFVFFPRI